MEYYSLKEVLSMRQSPAATLHAFPRVLQHVLRHVPLRVLQSCGYLVSCFLFFERCTYTGLSKMDQMNFPSFFIWMNFSRCGQSITSIFSSKSASNNASQFSGSSITFPNMKESLICSFSYVHKYFSFPQELPWKSPAFNLVKLEFKSINFQIAALQL